MGRFCKPGVSTGWRVRASGIGHRAVIWVAPCSTTIQRGVLYRLLARRRAGYPVSGARRARPARQVPHASSFPDPRGGLARGTTFVHRRAGASHPPGTPVGRAATAAAPGGGGQSEHPSRCQSRPRGDRISQCHRRGHQQHPHGRATPGLSPVADIGRAAIRRGRRASGGLGQGATRACPVATASAHAPGGIARRGSGAEPRRPAASDRRHRTRVIGGRQARRVTPYCPSGRRTASRSCRPSAASASA